MSAQGDLNFIAAKVSEIDRALKAANDERLDSFKGLLSSVETMLADLVANVEKGGGAAAIEAMAAAIKGMKLAAPDVSVSPQINVMPAQVPVSVNVPEQLPPTVNVSVEPTPVTVEVEAVMPEMKIPPAVFNVPRATSWELRIKGQYGAPDKVMTITPKYED